MKTNIKINVNGEPYNVKIDRSNFPYFIFNHDKLILASCIFPRIVKINLFKQELVLELISGFDELNEIIKNNGDVVTDLKCYLSGLQAV